MENNRPSSCVEKAVNWSLAMKQVHLDIAEGRKTINDIRVAFGLAPIAGGDVLTRRYV